MANNIMDKIIPSPDDSPSERKSKIITLALIGVGLAVVIAIIIAVASSGGSGNGSTALDSTSTTSQGATSTDTTSKELDPEVDPSTGILADLEEMFAKNSDFLGYIYIEGTNFYQPVMRDFYDASTNMPSWYYLERNFDKEYDVYGTVFSDYRTFVYPDGSTTDAITLYGHAGAQNEIFGIVKEYDDVEFYKQHPVINFDTVFGRKEYKIVSYLIEDVSNDSNENAFNYHIYSDLSGDKFDKYVSQFTERSHIDTGVDIQEGDHFIALSVCYSTDVTPYREVLIAREVREGESSDVDTSGATQVANPLMPAGL